MTAKHAKRAKAVEPRRQESRGSGRLRRDATPAADRCRGSFALAGPKLAQTCRSEGRVFAVFAVDPSSAATT
jgi:hypothetical protein